MNEKFVQHFKYIEQTLICRSKTARVLDHRGLKGKCREYFINEFLCDHLASDVGLANCEIIDAFGHTSPEIDIAVYKKSFPKIKISNNETVLLAECVYATIEIKSSLKSRKSIIECLDKIKKIKALTKQQHHGFYQPTMLEQEGRIKMTDKIKCFLIIYDSASIQLIQNVITEYYKDNNDPENVIDFVLLLDKACLLKVDGLLFEPGASNPNYTIKGDGNQLLYFFLYLTRLIQRFSPLWYELREYIAE